MYQDHHIYYCEFSLNITLYNWIPPYLSFPSTFLLCLIYNDPKFYFFQIMITSKTFVKHITVESFVTSGVSQLVYFKITRSSKAFVTYFTHKRLFSSVNKYVLFKVVFWLHLKSHTSKLNGLSPVWINSWPFRLIDVEKHLSHTLPLFLWSPFCTSMCCLRLLFCLLLKSHTSQLNGLSPVWINLWPFKLLDAVKFYHVSYI